MLANPEKLQPDTRPNKTVFQGKICPGLDPSSNGAIYEATDRLFAVLLHEAEEHGASNPAGKSILATVRSCALQLAAYGLKKA